MRIEEMSTEDCFAVLNRAGFGRLACARNNQPYVVPIYFTYDGTYIYGFATLGQKVEWMRTNPLICLEIDEISSYCRWTSVIVFGRYEELEAEPETEETRDHAHKLLQTRAMWWEPAYVTKSFEAASEPLTPIFYRIHIDRITGHHALPDSEEEEASSDQTVAPAATPPRHGRRWLRGILRGSGARQ